MRGTAYTVTSSDLSSMPIEEFRTTLTRMFFLADGKPRICGGGRRVAAAVRVVDGEGCPLNRC